VQPAALRYLAEKGYDPEMGARPLRRTLQTDVEDKLAEMLLGGELDDAKTLKIGCRKNQLVFTVD
ncbi:hypothetical protein ABWL48_20755, partial [Streptococcus suis]